MLRPQGIGAVIGAVALLGGCGVLPFMGPAPGGAATPAVAPASPPPPPKPAPKPATPPIVGGYTPTTCAEADCKAAQEQAVQAIYQQDPQRGVLESAKVEVQVVAGLNYRFHITMTGGNRYTITVYRDLQGQMTVSSFAKEITPQ